MYYSFYYVFKVMPFMFNDILNNITHKKILHCFIKLNTWINKKMCIYIFHFLLTWWRFTQLTINYFDVINLTRAPNLSNNVNRNTIIYCPPISISYYDPLHLWTRTDRKIVPVARGNGAPCLGMCPIQLTHEIPRHGIPPVNF